MYEEPYPDVVYRTLTARAVTGLTQAELAKAYADANRKLDALYRDLSDPRYERVRVRISERCELWEELEEMLYCQIVEHLRKESAEAICSAAGSFNIVRPFMERNGFRAVKGCWVRK